MIRSFGIIRGHNFLCLHEIYSGILTVFVYELFRDFVYSGILLFGVIRGHSPAKPGGLDRFVIGLFWSLYRSLLALVSGIIRGHSPAKPNLQTINAKKKKDKEENMLSAFVVSVRLKEKKKKKITPGLEPTNGREGLYVRVCLSVKRGGEEETMLQCLHSKNKYQKI